MHEILSYLLVYYSVYLAAAIVLLTVKNIFLQNSSSRTEFLLIVAATGLAELPTLLYSYHPVLLAFNFVENMLLVAFLGEVFKNYTYSGINFYLANIATLVTGLAWGAWFLVTIQISLVTRVLLTATAPLLAVTVPSGMLQLLEQYDIICRKNWTRPRDAFPRRTNDLCAREPMVSIHVPTYSEPPEMVIETLNKLAALNYNNFEVLVIDNNTRDSALWIPVKEHCKKLGRKFRFFHIDNLPGAKGGALNFAMKHTSPWANLVAVIDADYHAEPEFLRALVGHFDDPKIGFVQTPHDYRAWQGNLYLTMCYWEYKIFFHSTMISLNERDAGLTVGTMCIIRKQALHKAGGWSEWCVTEDSELAIRIHNAGYSSVYVDETYGRGLIPDTLEAYKKQRFRWTAGPVQEFQHHAALFLGLAGKPSEFTFTQRIFHINHGLANVILALSLPTIFLSILTIASMIFHGEVIAVPFELWLTATVLLLANPMLMWLVYRMTIKPTMGEIFGQILASKALSHVIMYSALKTLLTGEARWTRTNKFKETPTYIDAIISTREELFVGICMSAFIACAYIFFPYTGLALMFLIGLSYTAFGYFMAPIVGLINVRSMRKGSK